MDHLYRFVFPIPLLNTNFGVDWLSGFDEYDVKNHANMYTMHNIFSDFLYLSVPP